MNWDDADIEAALEWQAYKDSLCSGCGTPRDEGFREGREEEERWDAELLLCNPCRTRERKLRNFRDAPGETDMAGLYAVVHETDRYPRW